MTEYKPTEYVVDFGDYRSNQFVRLNMALIEQNSAKLHERIVRCRDCKYMFDWAYDRMLCKMWADGGMDDDAKNVLYPTVEPDGFCSRGELRGDAE